MVTFHAGTGNTNIVRTQYYPGSSGTVLSPANSEAVKPSSVSGTNWTLVGWGTTTASNGISDVDENTAFVPSQTDYYARWSRPIIIAYNGNGAAGSFTFMVTVRDVVSQSYE